jgi:hypothetical protein
MGALGLKFQMSKSKYQTNSKLQTPKTKLSAPLFKIWALKFVWDLLFVI